MLGNCGEIMLDAYSGDRVSGVDPVGSDSATSNDRVYRGLVSTDADKNLTVEVGSRGQIGYANPTGWTAPYFTSMRWVVEIDE